MSVRPLTALVSLFTCSLCGCGEGVDRPDTVPVSGKVNYNGAAVEGAAVVFSPTEGGPSASGTTDAAGKFKLSTFEAHDGAVAGKYRVTVSKTKQTGGKVMSAEEEHEAIMAGEEVEPPSYEDLVPSKYKNSDTSGLTAEVKEGEENTFTFELQDG